MIHATFVNHERTLCGKETAQVKIDQKGSLGWAKATCPGCREEIRNNEALDAMERAASRRFNF